MKDRAIKTFTTRSIRMVTGNHGGGGGDGSKKWCLDKNMRYLNGTGSGFFGIEDYIK